MPTTCIDCGAEKPADEFYRHPRMASGHYNKCKPCYRYAAHRYRVENASKVHAADRRRPHRRKQPRDPRKKAAWHAVYLAVRSGRLVKGPCVDCGSLKVQAHHHDYSKPLDIEWLCFACHRGHRHGQLVEAGA